MSQSIINILRITPRDNEFLNRKLGSRGEIFFDQTNNTLRLFNGETQGGVPLAKSSLDNVSNAVFYAKAAAAGVGAAGITSFATISVAGQSNIVADSSTDTLTLVAGTGITITTNATTDAVTIEADSYSLPTATQEQLGGVKVDGSSIIITDGVISAITSVAQDQFTFNIAGDDSTQREITAGNTVKFVGSGNVTTSTDVNGVVTITGTASSSFSSLTDAAAASLTIDKIYLPAITMLVVTNNGTSGFRFDQYGSSDDPTIYVISGTTVAFNLQATGHPFLIQDNTLTNITTGLTHVSTSGVISTGSNAQGKDSGTLYWKIPASLGGVNYAYQCDDHAGMVGTITIKGIASI